MFKRETDTIQFEGPVKFLLVPQRNIGELRGPSPDIKDNEFWIAKDSSTIVNFLKGAPAQCLYILGNGTVTISHNANIKTNTGADKVLDADKVYLFINFREIWYETA